MKEIKLLEQLSGKKVILKENNDLLIPRRTGEEREKNHLIVANKKIQEYIKNGSQGDLILRNTPIEKLPNDLTKVGGSFYLQGSKIASLPDNLTVEGWLHLDNTLITSLPNNLKVSGGLDLTNTPLSEDRRLIQKYKDEGYKIVI